MSPTLSDRITLIRYDDPDEWIDAAAAEIGDALRADIELRGNARLLLSGGTTPAPVYQALAELPLDWTKLEVGLVDERWLSPQDSDSNAYLVRQSFLERAEGARFEPLVRVGKPLQDCVHAANLHAQHAPAACMAVLGMGGDGHTASFFPDADNLPALLDPASQRIVLPVHAPSGGEPRLTLSMARIIAAGFIALHIEGEDKLTAFENAMGPGKHKPIRAVIDASPKPVEVFWAP